MAQSIRPPDPDVVALCWAADKDDVVLRLTAAVQALLVRSDAIAEFKKAQEVIHEFDALYFKIEDLKTPIKELILDSSTREKAEALEADLNQFSIELEKYAK